VFGVDLDERRVAQMAAILTSAVIPDTTDETALREAGVDQGLKVMALTAISLILVFVGIFRIAASHDGDFLDMSFEVASAFGTVGLSRSYTGEVSDFGRAGIVVVMFLGRVGPLTLGSLRQGLSRAFAIRKARCLWSDRAARSTLRTAERGRQAAEFLQEYGP
jgi:Trk-type K+ transport system membrane component